MEFQLICILSSKSIIVCISELPKLSTRWTREATLCLLKAYRDLEWKLSDPKIKNKAVWQEIAKILSEHDFMFNAEKCERKMLNMKRDYRSVIDHNNKTGNDRKTHPYLDEMNEIFGLKPTVKPVAVASSMVTKPNGEKPKEGTEIENKKGKESRKRKISNNETFADMLKTMSAKSDERLEILQNMQQQQLDILNSFLTFMKSNVSKNNEQ